MKHTLPAILALAAAALVTGCETSTSSQPPKTLQETKAEGISRGEVADPLRDPRPAMPPTGPMFQPMR